MTTGSVKDTTLEERIAVLEVTVGFEGLDRAALATLARLAEVRLHAKGQLIFDEGDPGEFFRTVAGGRVKVAKSSASGRLFTTLVAHRGDTLNAVVLFDGSDHFFSARALDQAAILQTKRRHFLDFVALHPQVAAQIISTLGRIVRAGYERAMGMIEERVEERLLKTLFMLHAKFGPTLNFTTSELAELTGTTTETTIRILGQFKEEGIVETARGRVSILRPERLRVYGQEPFLI